MIKVRVRKRINPADDKLLKEIKISKINREYDIRYHIYYKNVLIGYVIIDNDNNQVEMIKIEEEFRRRGLATHLYNYIEKDLNIKLEPNSDLLPDGKAFWKARRRSTKK